MPHPHPAPPVRRRPPSGWRAARGRGALAMAMGVVAVVSGFGALPAAFAQGTSSTVSTSSVTSSTSTTFATTSTTFATSTAAPTTTSTAPPTTPPPVGAIPFPAQVVAPVVSLGSEARELAVRSIYVTAGAARGTATVVVRFRDPFELPRRTYRVSVVMGEPDRLGDPDAPSETDGARLRVSLTTNGGPTPVGKAEKWDGSAYQWHNDAEVRFDPSGLAAISIPVDIVPEGGVWVEVEDSVQGTFTSPIYGLDGILGRIHDGRLAPSSYGRRIEADGTVDDLAVAMTDLPVLQSVNQGMTLVTTAPAPTEVAGRKVVTTVDIVRFVADFTNGGVAADEIRVDRTAGTISLVRRRSVPPEDRTSAEGWRLSELPEGAPGAPSTLQFDLPAAAAGVDLELGDTTGLGVQRELTLDDGSTVVVPGLLATKAWFDAGALAAAADQPDAVPVPSPSAPRAPGATTNADDQQTLVMIAGGAVAALLVLGSVVVLLRRRRLTAAERTATTRERDRERAAAKLEKRERAGKADAADRLQNLADDLDEMRRTGQITALTAAVVVGDPGRDAGDAGDVEPATTRDETSFVPVTGQQPVVVLTGEVPAVDLTQVRGQASDDPGTTGDAGLVTLEDLLAAPARDRAAAAAAATSSPASSLPSASPAAPEPAPEPEPSADEAPRNRPPRPRRAPTTDPLNLLGDLDEMSDRLHRLAGPAEGPAAAAGADAER